MAPVNRRMFGRAVLLGVAGAVLLGRTAEPAFTVDTVARIFNVPADLLRQWAPTSYENVLAASDKVLERFTATAYWID